MAKQRSKGTGSIYRRTPNGPWIAAWFDHDGNRREQSTRCTDRASAERILSKHVAGAALRRDLVIDPRADRFSIEGRKPLAEHVAAYIAHCEHAGQDPHHVAQKRTQLDAMIAGSKATRLAGLTPDALVLHLSALKARNLSARSINFARQIAVAFYGWCVKTGRAESNPLRVVPKQDESRDRRRVRRPLTDDELSRLLGVARQNGREAWYLAAVLAGLRKGDLRRLTWGDVNLREGTITIRHGKAKRVDVIPMHPQLAEALQRRFQAAPGLPGALVWPEVVQDLTRLKDFLRAGIARRVAVLDDDGKPIMVGEGENAKPKTRIAVEDDEGRIIDLHALRTTLGTQLARAGVAPQLCQRIMRHSDYRTTLKHYTILGLTDTAKAVAQLPSVGLPGQDASAATGTTGKGAEPPGGDHQQCAQQLPQQIERRGRKTGAAVRGEAAESPEPKPLVFPAGNAEWSDAARRDTMQDCGRNSMVECQPSKLNVARSSRVARFDAAG